MPAVSQREYLRHSTGQDTADEQDEQMTGHLDEGPALPPPPEAGTVRPFAARRFGTARYGASAATTRPDRAQWGHNTRQPTAAAPEGLPPAKPVLPGTHHYPVSPAAGDHAPLDVGPASPYYAAGMAHGVPAPPHYGGRPAPPSDEQIGLQVVRMTDQATGKPVNAVPVFMVTRGAGARPGRRTAIGRKNVPAPGGDPFRLVTRDPHRHRVLLLNESSNIVRLTYDPLVQPAAAPGYGAQLPASMNAYLPIYTQDELWAFTEPGSSGGAGISIISEYDIPGGG